MSRADLSRLPDREAVVAGRFYPGSASELEREISNYLEVSDKLHSFVLKEGEEISALVVPHAGYIFSGNVAASAYNLLKGHRRKTVFLIGSSHHALYNKASVYYEGKYKTPLGEVSIDSRIAKELLGEEDVFGFYPEAHRKEHSLEVQIPFLQMVFSGEFKIVPILIGGQSSELPAKIAGILAGHFEDPDSLFIISTDLSHYPSYNDARKVDKNTVAALAQNSPEKFLSYLAATERKSHPGLATSMCGWTSALTLLHLTHGKDYFQYKPILYQNSGDIPIYGDKSHVVGYQSLAVVRSTPADQEKYSMSREEKELLLNTARQAIVGAVTGKETKTEQRTFRNEGLSGKQGAFVSVYVDNELRGCIGRISTDEPLHETIRRMAVAAATSDNRFRSINKNELDNMKIEISVLSPLKPIKGPDEIIPGKHGIVIRKGVNSGTFLPQVAEKTGWNAEQMLAECSERKAGLGRLGWKDAEIFSYEALVFSDKD